MSERPYKVEQWSKGFDGITNVILEASDPNDAHAEFDRVVKHRPRGWYTGAMGNAGHAGASSDTAAEMMGVPIAEEVQRAGCAVELDGCPWAMQVTYGRPPRYCL
jgi:hypothetical protein